MKLRPVAAGTLPIELINAIRSGTVMIEQISNDAITFHDSHEGINWNFTLNTGEIYTYLHQKTGVSGSARISHFTNMQKKVIVEVASENSTLHSDANKYNDVNIQEKEKEQHNLAMKVAYFLAPSPKDHRDLLNHLKPVNNEVLENVLAKFTILNRRGQRELLAAGYEILDIEIYNSKAIKQQVANLALPKIAHDKILLDKFALYADRDVMLAVCSKGIMAGLGSSKRRRKEDDDDDDDDENNKVDNMQEQNIENVQEKNKKVNVLYTSMEQSGIHWAEADLSRNVWVMSSTVKEILNHRQRHNILLTTSLIERENNSREKSITTPGLLSMPIMNTSQLTAAQGDYALLHREYQNVSEILKRLEEVSEAARGWCQSNSTRFSEELRIELKRWFEMQEEPRKYLTTSLDTMHKALYELKREIEDYVNLHEWGVLS